MPEPLRCHRIPLPTWRALVVVIVGGDVDELAEVFRSNRLSKAEAADLATFCATQMRHTAAVTLQPSSRPRRQFVYYAKKPDLTKPDQLGTLARGKGAQHELAPGVSAPPVDRKPARHYAEVHRHAWRCPHETTRHARRMAGARAGAGGGAAHGAAGGNCGP